MNMELSQGLFDCLKHTAEYLPVRCLFHVGSEVAKVQHLELFKLLKLLLEAR